MYQPSFFELDERFKKLDEIDPLIGLNKLVDWEVFRDTLNKIRKKERKSNAGRKPLDVVVMFKALVLLKRPSQNRPLQPSSLLAMRATVSFKQRINQDISASWARHSSIFSW